MKATAVHRAQTYDKIKPLVALCKAGKLFEVQGWIARGKPVNTPPLPTKGRRWKTPLSVAIDQGFHSLVDVLLGAGAVMEPEDWASPMYRALEMRRFDIVQLLIKHGFDPRTVSMQQVFETWDPEIMVYFIDKGADMETRRPLAYALCGRIRTALGIFKRYRTQLPFLECQEALKSRHS